MTVHLVNENRQKYTNIYRIILIIIALIIVNPAASSARDLELRVIDKATGEALAEVEVKACSYNELSDEDNPIHYSTNEDGICRISIGDDDPEYFLVCLKKDGYTSIMAGWSVSPFQHFYFKWGNIPDIYTMALEKPGVISGIVTDEKNKPIENVKVSLGISSDYGRNFVDINDVEIFTNNEGKWKYEYAPRGEFCAEMEFSHPLFVKKMEWILGEYGLDELRDGSFKTILKKGITFFGIVRDINGNPVPGATVSYNSNHTRRDRIYSEVITNTSGMFTLGNVFEGRCTLDVIADGYQPVNRNLDLSLGMKPIEFKLEPGFTIKGKVVDEQGAPVKGVEISGVFNHYIWRVYTDSEGRFICTSAPFNGLDIDIRDDRFKNTRDTHLAPGQEEHVIVLQKIPIITGRIYDLETGEPIQKFKLIEGSEKKYGDASSRDYFKETEFYNRKGEYKILYQPCYVVITGQPVPEYNLCIGIMAEGYAFAEKAIDIEKGGPFYDFKLKKESAPIPAISDFRGVVKEKDSNLPLAGVEIILLEDYRSEEKRKMPWLSPPGGLELRTVTNEAGEFEFSDLRFLKGDIVLKKEGFASDRIRDIDLSEPFEYFMAREAVIKGKVEDDSGKPIPFSYIGIIPSVVEGAFTDQKGEFEFRGLKAGEYNLNIQFQSLEDRDYSKRKQSINHDAKVNEGQIYTVVWDKAGKITFSGKVLHINKPIPGVDVKIVKQHGYPPFTDTQKTDAEGGFNLKLIEEGEYYLKFSRNEDSLFPEINTGEYVNIEHSVDDYELLLGVDMIGKIEYKKDGKPVPHAGINIFKRISSLEPEKESWRKIHYPCWKHYKSLVADIRGYFKVHNIIDGEYLFIYWVKDIGSYNRRVITSGPFIIDRNKTNYVSLKIPEIVDIYLKFTDKDSGDSVEIEPFLYDTIECLDEHEFKYGSYTRKIENDLRVPSYKYIRDDSGRILFNRLQPGQYRLVTNAHDYYPAHRIDFSINKDLKIEWPANSDVCNIEMEKGGKIVFKFDEENEDGALRGLWIGYKLINLDDGAPVFKGSYDGYSGDIIGLGYESQTSPFIAVPAGRYRLDAVLRDGGDYSIEYSEKNIWSYSGEINIEKGKDLVIPVLFERKSRDSLDYPQTFSWDSLIEKY